MYVLCVYVCVIVVCVCLFMVKSHEMDSLLKFIFSNPNGLFTCSSIYPQKWSMKNLVLNFLIFNFSTVADIPTVADTFTLVIILGYILYIKVF